MLTMIHDNPVFVRDDRLLVDRKFHDGMQMYCRRLQVPICTVNPISADLSNAIDIIEVPLSEAGYSVLALASDPHGLSAGDAAALHETISQSTLIYGNPNDFGWQHIARRLRKPYVMMLEYDLDTRLRIILAEPSSVLRKALRATKSVLRYFLRDMSSAREAYEVHCNGYPIYQATRNWARRRLLYLDSRLREDDIISETQLESRLALRSGRPLKLLFSGRYEPLKGASDVVKTAVSCLRQGHDIELHCYGRGSLKAEMEQLAAQAPISGRIHIHDAVPFPELMAIAKTCDAFICCHIQNDPSCTYLESFGCGLPVAGYENRMWKGLLAASGGGIGVPLGDVSALTESIRRLISDAALLEETSKKARAFASAHAFEKEFDLRVSALRAALSHFNSGAAR